MLGWSTGLFIGAGVVHLLIGVLAPLLHERTGISMVVMSPRTDREFFRAEPEVLLAQDSIRNLRTVLFMMLAGALVAWGLLEVALAWFGVRQGQVWALGTLTVVGLVVPPFWYLAFRPYLRAGVSLGLGDMPPFIWVPTVLYVVAVALGWLGLRNLGAV